MKNVCVPLFIVRKLAKQFNDVQFAVLAREILDFEGDWLEQNKHS